MSKNRIIHLVKRLIKNILRVNGIWRQDIPQY